MSMGIHLKSGAIILVFVAGMVSIAAGRTIYVDDDGPADFDTIQAAIDDSNDGDTIIVADGVYTGEGNRDIEFSHGLPEGQTRAITVRSANGPENCIIDCNASRDGYNRHRGFRLVSGEDANSVISGFTIINGYAPCENYMPPFGVCGYVGGAIYCGWYSSPTISNCIFTGNSAFDSSGCGGGIGCHFRSNPTVSNCIFFGNRSYYGGGMGNIFGSDPTIINCTFIGNAAYNVGGGIYNGPFRTMEENNPKVINCILRDDNPEEINVSDSIPVITYSNIEGGWAGEGNINVNPCFIEAGHWEDPCNTPTFPWDDIWIEGDYHLKSQAGRWDANSESWVLDDVTSPCIDAGNPGCPVGDEPAPNGNRRNMGAYGGTAEASKSPTNWRSIADLTNDWVVDSNDLKVFVGYWLETGECIPSDLDRNKFVDFNDFALFSGSWPEFVIPDCLLTTIPEYPLWVALGKPECWCYPRQCHGDINGIKHGLYWIDILDLDSFLGCWYPPPFPFGCGCADFNHDGRVDYIDEDIIMHWFHRLDVPADCPGILYHPLGQLHQIGENWLEANNP